MQICKFLNNNCNIKILLANIHAYLDSAINFINDMFDLIRKEFIDDYNKYQLEMAHYLHYID